MDNVKYTGNKSKTELEQIVKSICEEFDCQFYQHDFDFIKIKETDEYTIRKYKEGCYEASEEKRSTNLYYVCYKMDREELTHFLGGVPKEYNDFLVPKTFHISSYFDGYRFGIFPLHLGIHDGFYSVQYRKYGEDILDKEAIDINDCYCAFNNENAAKKFLSEIVSERHIGAMSKLVPIEYNLDSDFFL